MSYGGGDLYFYFEYGDRSGFNFALEIRAVDLNGNLGPPTTITIGEDQATSGCSTSSSSTLGAALLALLAVLARPRRRR
jgi:MYXO-CTERM domain-containing protein